MKEVVYTYPYEETLEFKFLTLIVGIVVLFASCLGCYVFFVRPEQQAKKQEIQEAISRMEAGESDCVFDTVEEYNSVAVDMHNYKSINKKIITVSGTINTITKYVDEDEVRKVRVNLLCKDDYGGVNFMFNLTDISVENMIDKCKEGDTVTIRGWQFERSNCSAILRLEECVIIEN